VGDYDNDGYDDLYVSCALGPGHLFHNEGGRRFRDVTVQAGVANAGGWGTSCAWVDYDRDGKLDLFVCNYVKYRTLADDIPCYEGGKRVNCRPGNHEPSACKLYHNEGGGPFKDVSLSSGIGRVLGKSLGVAIWDYDHDGRPDIFVANDMSPGFLFHNNGNGAFTNVGAAAGVAYTEDGQEHSGMGIDVDDVMNDGKAWVTITNFEDQETSLYRQVTTNTFDDERVPAHVATATHPMTGFGARFFDYDNDGWKDLLQVNGHIQQDIQEREPGTTYAQPTLLFHNEHDGTFAEVGLKSGPPFSDRIVGRGCAWGDFDNDGRLDLLITTNDGPVHLWRNITSTRNHWLTLRLIGTKSNRDGIGAEVIVRVGGLTQRTMVRSGSSYLSASDLRPHFGLGPTLRASVVIHWPSGTVDSFSAVEADHIWTAREGARALQ
ncbi:MAG TPA: CRTAC1 family protein, partial [Chthonomonadaceae bacterium]|nr:CRTAC1 family protein [Chthonomonadaceae bacterium]